jgi:hypothetical protein
MTKPAGRCRAPAALGNGHPVTAVVGADLTGGVVDAAVERIDAGLGTEVQIAISNLDRGRFGAQRRSRGESEHGGDQSKGASERAVCEVEHW